MSEVTIGPPDRRAVCWCYLRAHQQFFVYNPPASVSLSSRAIYSAQVNKKLYQWVKHEYHYTNLPLTHSMIYLFKDYSMQSFIANVKME